MGHCHCIRGETRKEEPQIPLIPNSDQSSKSYKKLLILGNESCGKSTIFKQINCIHGWGFNEEDRRNNIQYIRQSIVSSILLLLSKSQSLYSESYIKYKKCFIDLNNDLITKSINIIMQYRTETFAIDFNTNMTSTPVGTDDYDKLSTAIQHIWSQNSIKQTFFYRYKYPFNDNIDHFLDKTQNIFDENYMPNDEDLLKHRSRYLLLICLLILFDLLFLECFSLCIYLYLTVICFIYALHLQSRSLGVDEAKYELDGNNFMFIDVGDDQSQWVQCFDNIHGLIYVAALNDFCKFIDDKNQMKQSLELFEQLINGKWFICTEIIIFFNKTDLFKERLYENLKLSLCFNQWNGPNYDDLNDKRSMIITYFIRTCIVKKKQPSNIMDIYHLIEDYSVIGNNDDTKDNDDNDDEKHDEKEMEEWFSNCYDKSCDFIMNEYLKVVMNKNKTIFTHFVCGVDKDDIKHVLFDVQQNVLRSNLRRAPTLW